MKHKYYVLELDIHIDFTPCDEFIKYFYCGDRVNYYDIIHGFSNKDKPIIFDTLDDVNLAFERYVQLYEYHTGVRFNHSTIKYLGPMIYFK